MSKIINRYILREISWPFFMILFVLTFVLLMGKIIQITDLMVNKGVSLLDIAKIIFFLMPSFLIFAIPISLMISILIGLGRLSGDNEITAMKASGISLYQILYPVALASLIAFLMTAATSLFLVPHSNSATKNLLFDIAREKASIGIREKVFLDDFKGLLLYVDKIPAHGNFMEGVMISDTRITREPATIIARRAYLISDPKSLTVTLRLENGSTHMVDKNMKNYQKMDFSFYEINLNIESSIAGGEKARKKEIVDMTFGEMIENMEGQSLEETVFRELAIELNKKFSIPVSCIVFGILGIPLGIKAHRSVRSRGFSIGIFVVLLYYLLQLGGDALVETGSLPPLVGTWVPNLIFGTVAIYLFIMAAREKPMILHHRANFLRRMINNGKG